MMVEEKLRYRWVMLVWLMTVSLVLGLATSIMPALFDEIKRDLDLTHGQLGIIWGALALGTLLTAFIGGTLGDRYGIKKLIALGLAISSISCVLRAILPSFWGLTFAVLVLGIASGFIFPNIAKAVGMWFGSKELGRALGLITVEGAAGWAIALAIGATLSSALGGWQNVMWLMAAISFGAIIGWMAVARERPVAAADPATQELSTREGLRKVFRVRDLWFVAILELCIGGAAIANIGLLPETLEDRGMTSSMAGIYASVSTGVVAVFSFIGPYFSDRVGLRKLFVWPFLLISAATITFFGVFTGVPVLILIVVYSAALGTALPLFRALIIENERIGSHLVGSALGLVYTVNRGGAMVLPYAMGAMIDVTDEYWPAFLLLAVVIAAGAAFGVAVKETGLRAKAAALPAGPTSASGG